MGEYIFFFGFPTVWGLLFALPAYLIPVNRWLRQRRRRRVMAMVTLSPVSFLTFAYVVAQFRTVFICFEPSGFDGVLHCGPDAAAQSGFTSIEEMRAAISQELFWRSMIPRPFRQECFADNQAFCDFLEDRPTAVPIWWGIWVYGWPPLVTGWLVWWWTRPLKRDPDEWVAGT